MKKLKDLFFVFMFVTTCVVFATAIYITIFWPNASLGVEILWQILTISFLTSLGIYVYSDKEVSPKSTIFNCILHYIYCNIVVLGCGLWFKWFYIDNIPMVLGMVIVIAVIFILVTAVAWKRTKKMAELMNGRLKDYQNEGKIDGSSHSKT